MPPVNDSAVCVREDEAADSGLVQRARSERAEFLNSLPSDELNRLHSFTHGLLE
jgi:hypothetical protein